MLLPAAFNRNGLCANAAPCLREVVMALSRNPSKKFLKGEEVKAFRISRNLTQPELASWLGLTPQAIAKYEIRGVTKAIALALSAVDRGLQPFKPTKADLSSIATSERMRTLRTRNN
jgi:DNA-binding XRE family transcriptional regulator